MMITAHINYYKAVMIIKVIDYNLLRQLSNMPVAKDIVSKFLMLSSVFSQSMAEENVIKTDALNTTVVEPTD